MHVSLLSIMSTPRVLEPLVSTTPEIIRSCDSKKVMTPQETRQQRDFVRWTKRRGVFYCTDFWVSCFWRHIHCLMPRDFSPHTTSQRTSQWNEWGICRNAIFHCIYCVTQESDAKHTNTTPLDNLQFFEYANTSWSQRKGLSHKKKEEVEVEVSQPHSLV